MNATDLMIGNLVEYEGVYYKVIDILTYRDHSKVTLQRKGFGITTIVGVKVELLDPVLITEDILDHMKPNAVIYNKFGSRCYVLDNFSRINFDGKEAELVIEKPYVGFMCNYLVHLHKLQQVLNFAGYKIEFEL